MRVGEDVVGTSVGESCAYEISMAMHSTMDNANNPCNERNDNNRNMCFMSLMNLNVTEIGTFLLGRLSYVHMQAFGCVFRTFSGGLRIE